jgi:hypothetical protein
MAKSDLTANSKALLVALLEHEEQDDSVAALFGLPPNDIARAMGFRNGGHGGRGQGGRGKGHRVFGPAQKIIPTLNGLRGRGLIDFGERRDGLSGSAYSLSADGRGEALRLREAGVKAKVK